jgi:hypothetical protein
MQSVRFSSFFRNNQFIAAKLHISGMCGMHSIRFSSFFGMKYFCQMSLETLLSQFNQVPKVLGLQTSQEVVGGLIARKFVVVGMALSFMSRSNIRYSRSSFGLWLSLSTARETSKRRCILSGESCPFWSAFPCNEGKMLGQGRTFVQVLEWLTRSDQKERLHLLMVHFRF